jgi:hypothetical protein
MGSTTEERKRGIYEDLQRRVFLGKASLIRQAMWILGKHVVRTSGRWKCLSKVSCYVLVRTNDKAWSVSGTTQLIASTLCGINTADHITNRKKYCC